MNTLGQTRGANRRDHLLQTPDTFVRTAWPGLMGGEAIVHIAPTAGARFAQYTLEMPFGGTLASTSAERFLYVLEGQAKLFALGNDHVLNQGGYAYIPPYGLNGIEALTPCRLAVIERLYIPLGDGTPAPSLLIGDESTVAPMPLLGDPDLQVRTLLPNDPTFDFAVNTMTYQPGASLAQVEVHVMEHGLLMLQGGGIYRVGDDWYAVTAGDFIWMAPFCPQWFGALGKTPAKYLIYKDTNRHPLK